MKEDTNDKDKQDKKNWDRHERLRAKLESFRRVHLGQRGFLRPEIIQLFEQGPMNGVDIMNNLQEMSHGWYRPSPGSIYPLLDQLEREGLISKNKEGKFELTSAYVELSGLGQNVSTALSTLESNTSYLEDIQRAEPAHLSNSRERIQKLVRRLQAVGAALEQGASQS